MKTSWRRFQFLVCGLVWIGLPSAPIFGQQTKKAAKQPVATNSAASSAASASAPSTPAAIVRIPKTPKEYFARARQLSDLEAAGIPFHLKATFVASGKTEYTGKGTYQVWWQSKNVWRKQATLDGPKGDYKYVAIHNGKRHAASATMAYTPLRVRQVEGLQIFDISLPKEKKPVKWKITHMNLNGVPLTVVGSQAPCDPENKSARCPTGYSFTNEGLLWGYRDDDIYERYTDFQPFGNQRFPKEITLALRGKRLLDVHVSTLERLPNDGRSRFDPDSIPKFGAMPSPLVQIENGTHKKGVTPPKLIHHSSAEYPMSMRSVRRSFESLIKPQINVVVIACTVDTQGVVREPYVQRSSGKAFDQSAMEAVQTYKFKPAMKNGQSAMIDVNIVVVFHLR